MSPFHEKLTANYFLILIAGKLVAEGSSVTPEGRLITDLLKNYTREARPVNNPKDRIVVVFGFELVQLVNVVSKHAK